MSYWTYCATCGGEVHQSEDTLARAHEVEASICVCSAQQERALSLEPQQEIDRAALLDGVTSFLRRYVVMSQAQADTIALWLAHSHAIEAADCTPYLAVTSKEKRSGKTRLLEVIELLARNPVRSSDITESALFHALSEGVATLLLDEIDTVFRTGRSREPLRALLNASYRRGSPIRRMRGREMVEYEAFGAKIIAGIGELPDTVADRSIPIRLERKDSGAHVARFRAGMAAEDAADIRRDLARAFVPSRHTEAWMRDLAASRPDLPDHLNDRQQDSWEPLLQIADAIGGTWPDRARRASRELHASTADIRIRG